MQIIKNGVALDYSEEEASRILSQPEVTAVADIKEGTETACAWGCDLTFDICVRSMQITAPNWLKGTRSPGKKRKQRKT